MNHSPKSMLAVLIISITPFGGCSHSLYKAEVEGPGASVDTQTFTGVIYKVPPKSTQLRVRVVSLGIQKNEQNHPTLRMRIYFARKKSDDSAHGKNQNRVREFLDPKEQSVTVLEGGNPIYPDRVFANTASKPRIELIPNQKQMVELSFLLPAKIKTDTDLQTFTFAWKIHYAPGKTESQVTRFDRQDLRPQNNSEFMTDPDYPDYPIHEFMTFPTNYEWVPMGWDWW